MPDSPARVVVRFRVKSGLIDDVVRGPYEGVEISENELYSLPHNTFIAWTEDDGCWMLNESPKNTHYQSMKVEPFNGD